MTTDSMLMSRDEWLAHIAEAQLLADLSFDVRLSQWLDETDRQLTALAIDAREGRAHFVTE